MKRKNKHEMHIKKKFNFLEISCSDAAMRGQIKNKINKDKEESIPRDCGLSQPRSHRPHRPSLPIVVT